MLRWTGPMTRLPALELRRHNGVLAQSGVPSSAVSSCQLRRWFHRRMRIALPASRNFKPKKRTRDGFRLFGSGAIRLRLLGA